MKKYVLLTTVFMAFALIFTACNKEGVYNPKQKISKIYTQNYYHLEKKLASERTCRNVDMG